MLGLNVNPQIRCLPSENKNGMERIHTHAVRVCVCVCGFLFVSSAVGFHQRCETFVVLDLHSLV